MSSLRKDIDIRIQPAYDYNKKKIVYAEILVRKYRGIDSVKKIIKFVKLHNLEMRFDLDILDATLISLENKPELSFPIGVNLCPKSIEIDGAAESIIDVIEKHTVNKKAILFEISEDTNFSSSQVAKNINKLREYGLKIALDDFGVKKANLYSLLYIKADFLKIDKVFIDKLVEANNKNQIEILKSIKDLCDKLKLKTIVEGIEDHEQLRQVIELGYGVIQGFYYEKPMKIEKFFEMEDTKHGRVRKRRKAANSRGGNKTSIRTTSNRCEIAERHDRNKSITG